MAEKKEPPLDKGCILAGVLGSIFFMVPILAWWIPVGTKFVQWVKGLLGF